MVFHDWRFDEVDALLSPARLVLSQFGLIAATNPPPAERRYWHEYPGLSGIEPQA